MTDQPNSLEEPKWRIELKDLIREVVREELANSHKCRFNLEDNEAIELGQWLKKLHKTSEKINLAIVLTIVSTLVAGTIGAFWLGLKTLVVKGAN